MTHRHPDSLRFASLGSRKIEADFAGGLITSDSGVLLLREIERRTGLIDALDKALPDPRDSARIEHDQKTMIAQRIYAIALGYEDLNDHKTLRGAVDQPPDDDPDAVGASTSTLHRFENRADRKSLVRMAEAFVDDFIASYDEPPESLILDFDATDSEIHGHQEGRFFHGYYDCYCYLSLYVFCGDGLAPAQQDRRRPALAGRGETVCAKTAGRVAERTHHDSGRLRILPLAATAGKIRWVATNRTAKRGLMKNAG